MIFILLKIVIKLGYNKINYNINKQIMNKNLKSKYKVLINIFFLILLILFIKFKNYSIIDNKKIYIPKNLKWEMPEQEKLYNLLNLKRKPINPNDPLIIKEKKELLNQISNFVKRKNFSLEYIYLTGKFRFGNFLITLNNAIFFCEILGCKKIIIENYNNLYIKHKILNKKYNMTIEPLFLNKYIIKNSLVIHIKFFFYYYKYIKPEIRLNLIKNEILNNLPKLNIHPNDLYIHIRSGDIFQNPRNNSYSQPPLCFYKKILNKFVFRKVYIITENKNNPIINILLKDYNFVKYLKNPLYIDISFLANSYNIVSSTSSFLINIIKLNDNLKYLWEYDNYRLSQKYFHLHYSVYNFPHNYTIYKMIPSKFYNKFMYNWYNSPKQRKIMIKEKCKNKFIIISPTFLTHN